MKVLEIRNIFLNYFKEKGHTLKMYKNSRY